METFNIFLLRHRGMDCLGLKSGINDPRNTLIKKIPGVKWSQTHKCWYASDTSEMRKLLGELFGYQPGQESNIDDASFLQKPEMSPSKEVLSEHTLKEIQQFVQWLQSKRNSKNTIKVYVSAITVFFKFYHYKQPSDITNDDIVFFNNEYILKKKLSATYQSQMVSAIKMFYQTQKNTKLDITLVHRPKTQHHWPKVLSKSEVKLLLDSIKNLKHKAMLSVVYACGLRRSELLGLKPTDIDSKRNIVLINQAKGNRDRIVPLSSKLLELLREYFLAFRPKDWLFEGQVPGTRYGERSIELVFKKALKLSGIKKNLTLHSLRHSFATHLHESGCDIGYIQKLLGHKSSRTTEIYMHISVREIQNIRSPFDDI